MPCLDRPRLAILRLTSFLLAATLISPSVALGQQQVPETPESWFTSGQQVLEQALAPAATGDRARNVILFVGDGMGLSTVTAARILEGQLRDQTGEENLLAFETLPYLALSKTYSVNQQVSESAATMTAMVTGVKTTASVVSLDQSAIRGDHTSAPGTELPTLLELAERAGLATGLISTAALTHATLAATYAHTVERDWENDSLLSEEAREAGYPDIARQFTEFTFGDGIDVVFAGGRQNFLPETISDPEYELLPGSRFDGRHLVDEWAARYPEGTWVWNQMQFDAINPATATHVLGLFEPGHMQFEHDRIDDGAGEPSLTDMTIKAVEILSQRDRGYLLIVEAGRIDHGHHAGNAYRALTETIELSNAVAATLARVNQEDTLVVVTADHSHTLALGGYPIRGNPILGKVTGNDPQGLPKAWFDLDLTGQPFTTLTYANGPGHTVISNQQLEGIKTFPHSPNSVDAMGGPRPSLSFRDTAAPDYLQESLIPLTSETHGGEDVPLYASGPAAHLFRGVFEQHVVFHVLAYALRLER